LGPKGGEEAVRDSELEEGEAEEVIRREEGKSVLRVSRRAQRIIRASALSLPSLSFSPTSSTDSDLPPETDDELRHSFSQRSRPTPVATKEEPKDGLGLFLEESVEEEKQSEGWRVWALTGVGRMVGLE